MLRSPFCVDRTEGADAWSDPTGTQPALPAGSLSSTRWVNAHHTTPYATSARPPTPILPRPRCISPQHVSLLSRTFSSHQESLSLIVGGLYLRHFIPYSSRWNLVVRSLSTTRSNHSLQALLLDLEPSIFSCGLCPGHRSVSTICSLLTSLNTKETLLFHTLKSIATNSLPARAESSPRHHLIAVKQGG